MKFHFLFYLRWILFILLIILLAGCASASEPSSAVETEKDINWQTNVASEATEEPAEVESPPSTDGDSLDTADEEAESQITEGVMDESPQPGQIVRTEIPGYAPSPSGLPTATEELIVERTTPRDDVAASKTVLPSASTQTGTVAPTAIAEARLVELEYPPMLRLGDSDVIRLALIPYEEGYIVQTDFPDHTTITQTVQVERPVGYNLLALARLDGVGFTLSPAGEQEQNIPAGEEVIWRWSLTPRSAGQQRLNVMLALRWVPIPEIDGTVQQITIYSHSMEVRVLSFLGLTSSQALLGGLISLAMGGTLGLVVLLGGGKKLARCCRPWCLIRHW